MGKTKHGFSFNSLKELRMVHYFSNSKPRQVFLFASASILFLIVAYLWFISFGLMTRWPPPQSYYVYDQLANAFRQGQLSLEKKPSAALIALPNPYDPAERAGIPIQKDYSLYRGKYYLYFGPAPALFLTVIKSFVPGQISDQYLVFAFVCGIGITQSLLIVYIWKRFFHQLPIWIIPLGILFSGLIVPLTGTLTEARVYEAASSGGQFFFLAGLYLVITALNRESISAGRLFLGGTSWAFALGSRLTLALPIGFVTLMAALAFLGTYRQTKLLCKTIFSFASLALPLAVGLALLGLYNWARFHSIFETGFSYQLAGPELQKYKDVLFSPLYILPNLYNYLAMPPKITGMFPFLKSIQANGAFLFSFIPLPNIYFAPELTGMFFSVPFILFAVILIVPFLHRKKEFNSQIAQDDESYFFKWTVISLFGSFLFGFIPMVSFFWVALHYFLDFSPSLVLLSMIGFWQGYAFLLHRPISRKLYAAAGIGLMIASVLISNLLMFSGQMDEFQKFNPVLWQQLANLFIR